MRRLYFIISFLFLLSSLSSQESNQNYITTRTMIDDGGSRYIETIQYYDGLGRPFLNVQKGVTAGHANLATLQEYDGFGRKSKTWFPYVTTSKYVDPAAYINSVSGTYDGDSRPYAESVYEHSPLNRVVAEHGPGAAWETHPVSISYLTNTSDGELSCKFYSVTSSGDLAQNGLYTASELYVVKNVDEDGNVSYLFTDKLGRQILSRQMLGSVPHDTYHVYDDFDNRRFVLPPAYQDAPSLALYAYQYKYDGRSRCIEKTLPGCDVIKYVYDKADHLIFSQDGVQRDRSEWTFYLYDAFQRLVVKGVCQNVDASPVSEMLVNCTLNKGADGQVVAGGIGGSGYSTNLNLPSSIMLHQVNYYDNYAFLSLPGFNDRSKYPLPTINATGLPTGGVTYLLNHNTGLCSATYYDIKGQPVKTVSDNHLGGHEVHSVTYSFTGKPRLVQNTHTAVGHPSQTELRFYYYDHAERLIRLEHQLNGNIPAILAENEYDELGRLKIKKRNKHIDALRTTYTYNIRNWLKGIRSSFFKQDMCYETGPGTHCYNGNVGSMAWLSGQETQWRGYKFTYDGLNRLTMANYGEGLAIDTNRGRFDEIASFYDKNGNIRKLTRCNKTHVNGGYGIVDNLAINHNGNQLKLVYDSGIDPLNYGFFNFEGIETQEYVYDKNGNLCVDSNKKIREIQYNTLNLPSKVSFADGSHLDNLYDATGVKRQVKDYTTTLPVLFPLSEDAFAGGSLRKSNLISPPIARFEQLKTTIDYCGNVVYENDVLNRILVEDAYITFKGSTPTYHFYQKDHQGNNRVVVSQTGSVEQVNHYYPFGGTFDDKTNTSNQLYKFGGKELNRMHGLDWYDFGARYLRNDAPGWMGVDPLCEEYYSISPYVYCLNNPIRYNDPDGMEVNDTIPGVVSLPEVTVVGYKVADPVVGFWSNLSYFLFGRTYTASAYGVDRNGNRSASPIIGLTYNVNRNGYTTGIAPMGGIAPLPSSTNPLAIREISNLIKSIKDLKSLKSVIKGLSKPNSALTQQELDELRKSVGIYGGRIRVDLQGVKGTGTVPHIHVEGLGQSIESRHIWIETGVK